MNAMERVVKRKRLEKLPWTSRLAIEMMSTGKMAMCMYMCALKYVYVYCKKTSINIYISIIYTQSQLTAIFEGQLTPKQGLFSNQNKGRLGSRYVYYLYDIARILETS